jgi:hypothetical protein
MIRVQKASGKFFGIKVNIESEDEIENIKTFTDEGTPIILVNDLADLEDLDIDPADVEMIEPD